MSTSLTQTLKEALTFMNEREIVFRKDEQTILKYFLKHVKFLVADNDFSDEQINELIECLIYPRFNLTDTLLASMECQAIDFRVMIERDTPAFLKRLTTVLEKLIDLKDDEIQKMEKIPMNFSGKEKMN
jgi:hypothetical protein